MLVYLTQQELEFLQACVFEALDSIDSAEFKDLIGYDSEEAEGLMQQLTGAIEMIKRGAEPGAFGQLRPKLRP